jgi:hypothetical protein
MQDLVNYVGQFLHTDTPFMLLFVSLFFYIIKTARERELNDNKIISQKLEKIDEELQVIIKVWKILLEKELEAKK